MTNPHQHLSRQLIACAGRLSGLGQPYRRPLRVFLAVGVVLLLGAKIIFAQAAVQTGWQTPEWIPGLVDDSPDQYPYFVTDPTGKVHVFHSQWVEDHFVIVYSSWTVGVGWAEPVDILAANYGEARISGAFLDDVGMLNLIFWGGEGQNADIYLSKAPLRNVMQSSAWSSPLRIGSNAIEPATTAVASDQNGFIAVVYSGDEEGNGLYSVISTDYGATWTAAVPLFFATNDSLWPTALQMILCGDGSLQAVWALGDETGNSRRIYHASLNANEMQWSSPTILAESIDYEADTPSMIEYDDSLIVIYHNDFPTTRYMTRSFDAGKTWTAPTRLFEQVGSNGAAALVVDSSDTLHMFFGNRVGDPAIHGLWHSLWLGEGWSVPEAVVSGPQVLRGMNGEEGFDPAAAQAVISQGNLLLLVWRHDPLAGPYHIWFSYRYLDTPELPTQAVVEQNNNPTVLPTRTQSELPETTPVPTLVDGTLPGGGGESSRWILTAGIGSAIAVIFAAGFIKQKNRQK